MPFGAEESDPLRIQEIIDTSEIDFPDDVTDEHYIGIIKTLLNKSAESRLTMTATNLMAHDFFKTMDWDKLVKGTLEAPYHPEVSPLVDSDHEETPLKEVLEVVFSNSERDGSLEKDFPLQRVQSQPTKYRQPRRP